MRCVKYDRVTGVYPGQNSRSASSSFLLPSLFGLSWHYPNSPKSQYWTTFTLPYKLNVRFILTSMEPDMARTMTVDLGDELREFIESLIESGDYRTQSEVIRESLRLLREKQAESRLQALRDLLAEGLSSGEPVEWEKDAFLKQVKAGMRASGENR